VKAKSSQVGNSLRVITYINIHISSLCFSLQNNHRNISCILFFNCDLIYFLINVYFDSSQTALKYLKDTEVNINNVLIMIKDFNIRNSFWDLNFLHHSSHKDTLFDITEFFHLELSKPTEFFPTRYSDNNQDLSLVLDLMFLCPNSSEHDNHHIYSDWKLTSDHTPVTISIYILEEYVQTKKQSLIKNSEKETYFINELINSIKGLNIDFIQSIDALEAIIQLLANNIDRI